MKKLLNKISEIWKLLGKTIYVGERLKANLIALTVAGIVSALIGLVMTVVDVATHQTSMLIPAIVTLTCGAACAVIAGVFKNRRIAILIPILFCGVVFTYYTIAGAGDGYAILWTIMLPIGLCYFVSVKHGIILSVYYALLFIVLFYTPIRWMIKADYPEMFITRFPLIYASLAVFTAFAMAQYHRGVLFENDYADRLSAEVEKQTRVANERADKLEKQSEEMVETLAVTIDAKDGYTNGHSFRVSWYSVALARKLGLPEEEIRELEREALLHDVGKIGVPDMVLNKPGRLTDEEFAVIKSHTTIGGNILSRSETLMNASEVARYHHERWDGRGYPEGLSGEAIPAHARIVALSDSYDAMHSDRVYRKGLPDDVIRREIVNGAGAQFDPNFTRAFLELFDSGELAEIDKREIVTVA